MEIITKVLFGLMLLSMFAFPGAAEPTTDGLVTDGLVVYYDGNLSGDSLLDLSGNNNIGYATSVTPGINQATGVNYINFNGVNSKIDVSNNAQTNVSSPISIEFIGSIHEFKQFGALVSKYDDGVTGWYLSCSAPIPHDRVRFAMGVQSGGLMGDKSEGSLVVGQVYHIVATYDNNTARIYIDGVNSGNHTWNSPIIGNSKNITIGSGTRDLPYGNCSMYAFRLYNRTLSPDEVWQNYVYDLPLYKVTPTITWSNPADIISGTALSSIQLNAVANDPKNGNQVLGNFTYTPAAGTVLSVGTHTLHVDFMPNDAANYTNATANVTINVTTKVPPVANFTADVTSGSAPLSVQFTDLSENATAWFWNFGDGSTSTDQNVSHTYNTPGIYTVSLNASNAYGYNISTKPDLINVKEPPVTNGLVVYYDGNLSGNSLKDLSGNKNTGYATSVTPGTDQVTGANYISFNGVNSKIDVSNNVQTNVSSPVSIEFIGSINNFTQYGTLASTYNNEGLGWYLSSSSADPYNHARFAAGTSNGTFNCESDASLVAGQVYHIVATYDNSTAHIYINGVDSGSSTWNFPIIGSPETITMGSYGSSSGGLNYCNCSMYTFRLYNRSLSSDEVLQNYKYDYWKITNRTTPTIIWNTPANITYGTALGSIQLNAVATDPLTGNQVLGNFTYTPAAGTVLSVGTHTLHANFTPIDAANYTTASKDVTINVKENGVPPIANFAANPTRGTVSLTVKFTDLSENAAGWYWDFGDGNSSTEQNPVHTYSVAGNYTVRLNVSNSNGYNISIKPDLINVIGYVTEGLVVYYDGNLSGSSLLDLSGNSNTGYATSAVQRTNQSTGLNYISLNGVNSKIDVSNNAQTNISSPISIEFIGSINNFTQYGTLVSKHKNWVSDWYLVCSSSSPYNQARFGAVTSGGWKNYESNAGLIAGQVYHIVATYDNSTVHIYINGEDSGSSTWNSPIIGGNENITIGSGYGLPYSNCSMYTFRLYNRSLTQDEVLRNYNNWICVPDPDCNITIIKKLAYGDGGLPRYMGSHAMIQSGARVSLVDSNLSSLGSVLTPYYQDNGSSETSYILLSSSVSGVKWKNYCAPGSSASLSFSGNNRTRLENLNLSNNSLYLSNSVTYTEDTLVTKEAVPVTGNAFQFYGDGLNTIFGNTVQAYTDNGEIQNDCIFNSTGGFIYNRYQNRTVGTTRSNSVDLLLSSPQLTPMPCPSGYLGSLSFAIHADAQDPDSLKTMMYGTNDINDPENSTKGYIGHGLICTWAAFAASSDGAGVGFDNASFKSTLDDMDAHRFEIVPHNVIGWAGEGDPTRNTTGYYLPWYTSNYSSRNWIDHGLNDGNRNTGLKSLGLDKSSPKYYIGDLLREHDFQYAWAYQDVILSNESNVSKNISTSRTQSLGLPYDIVWTNTNFTWDDGTPIYEWTSTYDLKNRALDYFNNATLQTMINSYGVCFWHDYTAYNGEIFGDYYFTKGNPYKINETYDNLLLNISEQNMASRLWNPTVSQYIDYWRAACNVECKCTGQDTYTLINHNSETVPGYAMRVVGSYAVKLDGNDLGTKKNGDDTVFWMDLSPGTHSLTLVRA